MTNVVRFPFDRARPSGSGAYAWPPCQVLVLPVIRVERDHIGDANEMVEIGIPTSKSPKSPRRKRRAKR